VRGHSLGMHPSPSRRFATGPSLSPQERGEGFKSEGAAFCRESYPTTSYPTGRAASVNHSQIEWAKLRIA
jgi:hypothetical protein